MTASRTWRSRSFRDPAMSPKLLPANNLDRSPRVGQVADEGIQPEPPFGAAHQVLVPDFRPTLLDPPDGKRRQGAPESGTSHPPIRPHRAITPLHLPFPPPPPL